MASGSVGVAARGRALGRLAWGLATGLCVVALPLGIVTTSVRQVTLDRAFYLSEFARYDRGAAVGLSPEELRMVADSFISYFQEPPGRMSVYLGRGGRMQPLFNERELAHMEDVQAIMHLVFNVQALALGYVGLYTLAGLALRRRSFLPLLARALAGGAGLTLAIVLALGALALADFSGAFVQFHMLSFSNDLWILDPRTDRLIQLFPQEFFLDSTLRIAALTVLQALALGAAGVAGILLARRAGGAAPRPRE
jgi:integral membrane protein (TIGR01906 family)